MAWRTRLRDFWHGVGERLSRTKTGRTRVVEPTESPRHFARTEREARYQEIERHNALLTEDYTDQQLREAAYQKVADWNFANFHPRNFRRNVMGASMFNVRLMLALDEDGFRQMASVNPEFYYK